MQRHLQFYRRQKNWREQIGDVQCGDGLFSKVKSLFVAPWGVWWQNPLDQSFGECWKNLVTN